MAENLELISECRREQHRVYYWRERHRPARSDSIKSWLNVCQRPFVRLPHSIRRMRDASRYTSQARIAVMPPALAASASQIQVCCPSMSKSSTPQSGEYIHLTLR